MSWCELTASAVNLWMCHSLKSLAFNLSSFCLINVLIWKLFSYYTYILHLFFLITPFIRPMTNDEESKGHHWIICYFKACYCSCCLLILLHTYASIITDGRRNTREAKPNKIGLEFLKSVQRFKWMKFLAFIIMDIIETSVEFFTRTYIVHSWLRHNSDQSLLVVCPWLMIPRRFGDTNKFLRENFWRRQRVCFCACLCVYDQTL